MQLKNFVGVLLVSVTSIYSSIFCCKVVNKYFNCTYCGSTACNKSNFYDSVQDAIECLVFMPYLCAVIIDVTSLQIKNEFLC